MRHRKVRSPPPPPSTEKKATRAAAAESEKEDDDGAYCLSILGNLSGLLFGLMMSVIDPLRLPTHANFLLVGCVLLGFAMYSHYRIGWVGEVVNSKQDLSQLDPEEIQEMERLIKVESYKSLALLTTCGAGASTCLMLAFLMYIAKSTGRYDQWLS